MKNLTKYLSLLSLSAALSPSLLAQQANPVAAPPASAETKLDASFNALANTIKTARTQAGEALKQRDKALAELAQARKTQANLSKQLEEASKTRADLSQQLTETNKQLAESKQSGAKWKQEADTMANQLKVGAEAREKLVALRTQMEKSLKNFATLEKSLTEVQEEFQKPTAASELTGQIQKLKAAESSMKQNFQKQAMDLKATATQKEKLAKQLAQEKKARKQTTEKLSALEKSNSKTTEELKSTRKQLAKALKITVKTETATTDLKSAQEKAVALQARTKEATARLDQANKTASSLEKEIQQKDALIEKLEKRMKEMSSRDRPKKKKEDS
ncbi:MAG: hypothetical protein ACSHX7_05730 [Luteolibacter sp.]